MHLSINHSPLALHMGSLLKENPSMPLSKQISTYDDVHTVLEAALAHGSIHYELPSKGKATHFKMRAHYYRKLLHAEIAKRPKAPAVTRTKFDSIMIRHDEDNDCRLIFTIQHGMTGKLSLPSGDALAATSTRPEDIFESPKETLDGLELETRNLMQSLNIVPDDSE